MSDLAASFGTGRLLLPREGDGGSIVPVQKDEDVLQPLLESPSLLQRLWWQLVVAENRGGVDALGNQFCLSP